MTLRTASGVTIRVPGTYVPLATGSVDIIVFVRTGLVGWRVHVGIVAIPFAFGGC